MQVNSIALPACLVWLFGLEISQSEKVLSYLFVAEFLSLFEISEKLCILGIGGKGEEFKECFLLGISVFEESESR